MASLTKPQRARLDKLATYLEGLPKGYRHFDMLRYVAGHHDFKKVAEYALKNGGVQHCGTVACAVGHGPAAGVLMSEKLAREIARGQIVVAWAKYSRLFVGPDPDSEYAHSLRFRWLFGSQWRNVDNHHYGAAARIRYLLDKGAVPDGGGEPHRAHRKLYAPYRIDAKVPS